ncbi:unnamed protein product [Ceutorhynchus assimilis]|uniref:Ig-like domain-containing protein n=1 Tax=Ceutorhynchus assimilis TaxID=467358 RepID=A0A9N9QFM2_9CUCU|nr:unnamed protein product [Ceutorhynchus assimilis]
MSSRCNVVAKLQNAETGKRKRFHDKLMGMYPHKYELISSNQQNGDCSIWVTAAKLELDDGSWACQVTANDFYIQDTLTSHPVRLVVRGAPQVLRYTATPEIFVESGQSMNLSVVVCADPRPRSVAWEWGSLRLQGGNEMGKFKINDVIQEEGEDCYLTTIHVKDTSVTDSRTYYLLVENDKGRDTHAVELYVNEPLQMSILVIVAGAFLDGLLVLVCVCIYAIKAEKCNFSSN